MNRLAAWIDHAAANAPDGVAWLLDGEKLSYAQLAQRARTFELKDTGRIAALADPSSAHLALAACAAAYRSLPFLPLNPGLLPARREALLAQCGADLAGPPRSTGIQLLIATSGTSGEPKAVMLSGANLAAAVAASQARLPVEEGDVWLNCLPLYHIGGMMILHRCAAAGAAMLLHQGFVAERVWAAIQAGQASHVSLTPPMLSRLLDLAHGEAPPLRLKYVLVGGAALAPELARRAIGAGWPLCVSYGMSETASQLATDCAETLGDGLLLPGFEVCSTGTASEPGAIWVRGPAVMAGYANPELAPGDGLQNGWFACGDLGWLDDAGGLHVVGRRDDILVSGGCNISPAEVEAVLLGFPGVSDAAVTALPDAIWGDWLVALIVGEADIAELGAWSRTVLHGALRPRLWRRVAALPRNPLGKLQRNELRKMAEELIDA